MNLSNIVHMYMKMKGYDNSLISSENIVIGGKFCLMYKALATKQVLETCLLLCHLDWIHKIVHNQLIP